MKYTFDTLCVVFVYDNMTKGHTLSHKAGIFILRTAKKLLSQRKKHGIL